MRLSNLSISNSEASRFGWRYGRGRLRRRILLTLCWTLGALVVIDIAVGFAFRLPADPRAERSALQSYFDYGRSIEGKLRRMVGSKSGRENPIVTAGWLDHECDLATDIAPGKLIFDIYGMSFSNMISARMEALDPAVKSQRFGGPAAPPNHSYA